jgi:tetratricopeptide (TPR) repeat protein
MMRLINLSILFALIKTTQASTAVNDKYTANSKAGSAEDSISLLSDDECANTPVTPLQRETVFERILAADYESLDASLPSSVLELKNRGAHRCWHKHSTFLEHLLGVHNILRLWNQGETIGRVGLLHSAYSNSYVNLALFDPNEEAERKLMKGLVGDEAEDLVHMFCIIDRQSVVVNTLLKGGFIPKEGISVPHLRKPEEKVFLSAETLRMLVVFTMADMADQYFGWQDRLFGGDEMVNNMFLPGDQPESHDSTALWPGLSQPGLWMSYLSELGAVARTFVSTDANESSDLVADLPPVFNNCTQVLLREDEAKARDLYWSVITGQIREYDNVIATLDAAIAYNPWAFEAHVVLAQKYLHKNNFEDAKKAASRALELQLQWGTAWDKRLSFAAWVAWTRVMYQRAEDKLNWPANSWDVNNFGLVR